MSPEKVAELYAINKTGHLNKTAAPGWWKHVKEALKTGTVGGVAGGAAGLGSGALLAGLTGGASIPLSVAAAGLGSIAGAGLGVANTMKAGKATGTFRHLRDLFSPATSIASDALKSGAMATGIGMINPIAGMGAGMGAAMYTGGRALNRFLNGAKNVGKELFTGEVKMGRFRRGLNRIDEAERGFLGTIKGAPRPAAMGAAERGRLKYFYEQAGKELGTNVSKSKRMKRARTAMEWDRLAREKKAEKYLKQRYYGNRDWEDLGIKTNKLSAEEKKGKEALDDAVKEYEKGQNVTTGGGASSELAQLYRDQPWLWAPTALVGKKVLD